VKEELPVVVGILDECATWLHSRGIARWALPQPPHEWEKMRDQIAQGNVLPCPRNEFRVFDRAIVPQESLRLRGQKIVL